jgi:geranylgeranyl pyrophosphate synthase
MDRDGIQHHLKIHLESQIPRHLGQGEIYKYCVLPPGKLFRPRLVWAIAFDMMVGEDILFQETNNHAFLASAVEIHHAYSLVHDDLPSMDNDFERRGKPSTHIKFGEWRAILVGDGLLNISYSLLSHIQSAKLPKILRLFGKFLGPMGLIQGQVDDLSGNSIRNFKSLLKTHELKTARLIQASILGSYLLTERNSYREFLDLFKLGHYLGITFQLLDDYTELESLKQQSHETEINAWLKYPEESEIALKKAMDKIRLVVTRYKLKNLDKLITEFYRANTHAMVRLKLN